MSHESIQKKSEAEKIANLMSRPLNLQSEFLSSHFSKIKCHLNQNQLPNIQHTLMNVLRITGHLHSVRMTRTFQIIRNIGHLNTHQTSTSRNLVKILKIQTATILARIEMEEENNEETTEIIVIQGIHENRVNIVMAIREEKTSIRRQTVIISQSPVHLLIISIRNRQVLETMEPTIILPTLQPTKGNIRSLNIITNQDHIRKITINSRRQQTPVTENMIPVNHETTIRHQSTITNINRTTITSQLEM